MTRTRQLAAILIVMILTLGLSISLQSLLAAWTGPTTTPPGGNVSGAINIGSSGQSKAGGLIVNTSGSTNGLIVQSGNVGIGATAPQQKLDVNGAIAISGSIVIDSGGNWQGTAIGVSKGGTGLTSLCGSGKYLKSNGSIWTCADGGSSGWGGGQIFTSAGTFVVPAGVSMVKVTAIGGGAGGQNIPSYCCPGGPGGQGMAFVTVTPGANIPVTIGSGGSRDCVGTAGGNTTFGSYVTAAGGNRCDQGSFSAVGGYVSTRGLHNTYGKGVGGGSPMDCNCNAWAQSGENGILIVEW